MSKRPIKKRKTDEPVLFAPQLSESESDADETPVEQVVLPNLSGGTITDPLPPMIQPKRMSDFLWTKEEDSLLELLVSQVESWADIAKQIPNKSARQCRVRWNRVTLDPSIRSGHWTPEEDAQIMELVAKHKNAWATMAKIMTTRTSEQIRGRYSICLNPARTKGAWSAEEHKIMLQAYYLMGNKWVEIAKQLPGRVSKQVGSHYFESVGPKLAIYLEYVGKEDYAQLTPAELDRLLIFLQTKRAVVVGDIEAAINKQIAKNKRKAMRFNGNGALITENEEAHQEDLTNKIMDKVLNPSKYVDSSDGEDNAGNGGGNASDSEDLPAEVLATLDRLVDVNEFKKSRRVSKVLWTETEDKLLEQMVLVDKRTWNEISKELGTKSTRQCQVRWKVALNPTIRLGAFTPEEDAQLLTLFDAHGNNWKDIAAQMVNRTPEQLRGRHNNLMRIKKSGTAPRRGRPPTTVGQVSSSVDTAQVCPVTAVEPVV